MSHVHDEGTGGQPHVTGAQIEKGTSTAGGEGRQQQQQQQQTKREQGSKAGREPKEGQESKQEKITERGIRELVGHADKILHRAEALPADVPNRQVTIDEARTLNKKLREVEKDVIRSSTPEDLKDLTDYTEELKKDLNRLDEQLPAGATRIPVTPLARPLTAEDAMAGFKDSFPEQDLNRRYPGRSWSGHLAERMHSDRPNEIKIKMIVTGEIKGSPPVSKEISVVYDQTIGTYTDFYYSSGKQKTR
jgi:hypothetical protein